ncbi:hypothetical protein JCM6882_004489 [Rhodosporidiobolus microsporus]
MLVSSALTALLALSPALSLVSAAPSKQVDKPNIVFIIVDDQDARQNTIDTMPRLQRLLVDEGTKFEKFYAPISVCCPSRTSFLRAQCAHNTNITSVMPPWGGWTIFNEKGYNGHWLPTFLQKAGYYTSYVGKLMNGHSVPTFETLEAQGWDGKLSRYHAFLLDPYTYDYWNPAFSKGSSGKGVEYRPGEYSTDLVAEKGLDLLEKAAQSDKPFFVGIAPIAPHSHIDAASHSDRTIPPLFDIPRPHPRHAHLFQDVTLNYSRASHNPDVPSGASWVRQLERLNDTNVKYIEDFYRGRLQSLQAVDELVEGVVKKLEELGKLDETIIIYTADNGFEANGGHRRQPGKTLGYEEDINVPLVVRGPGVPHTIDTTSVYSLADLGATILHLAGAESDYDHDGALVPLTQDLRDQVKEEGGAKQFHLAEYWVEGVGEGKYGSGINHVNQTYRTIRVVEGDSIDYAYTVWCTGEREIYNMQTDPDQMDNLALHSHSPLSFTGRLHARLDALLLVLKNCVGDVCRDPWATVFPEGGVKGLSDALNEEYDQYFEELPRVRYSHCQIGYFQALEKPFWRDELAYSPQHYAASGSQVVLGA